MKNRSDEYCAWRQATADLPPREKARVREVTRTCGGPLPLLVLPIVSPAWARSCRLPLLAVLLLAVCSMAHAEYGPYFTTATSPFCTSSQVKLDSRLIGRWVVKEKSRGDVTIIEPRDAHSYLARTEANHENTIVRPFRLNGRDFLDLQFLDETDATKPEHILVRVDREGSLMKFAMLCETPIDELLRKQPFVARNWLGFRIAQPCHDADELLKSPTRVLRAFLRAHGRRPELFEPLGGGLSRQGPTDLLN